jgi:hypothetical protein
VKQWQAQPLSRQSVSFFNELEREKMLILPNYVSGWYPWVVGTFPPAEKLAAQLQHDVQRLETCPPSFVSFTDSSPITNVYTME